MQHFLAVNRESLSKRASMLRIASVKLADCLKAGTFRSLYRGQGIEFSGVREYLRGDDVRAIDWNVTARMGKPFVKLFEEEHELQIFLVVDSSFSMFTGYGNKSRYETAAEAAALIAMAAEVNASSVGAVIFDGKIRFSCSPESGRNRTMLLLTRLDETDGHECAGSVLGSALTGAGKLLKKRSLVFVLSDFRCTGWIEPLAALSQKHDVVAVRITDLMDNELAEMGTVPFVDSETKKRLVLPTSSSLFRNAWRTDNRQHMDRWQEDCRRHGVLPLLIATDDDPVRSLSNFFIHRGQNV
ncbi:MAG: DUF58 domain-containing protein [Treponema sp.]|nr:DUF58 domain-containing protein [Treponema sp.]